MKSDETPSMIMLLRPREFSTQTSSVKSPKQKTDKERLLLSRRTVEAKKATTHAKTLAHGNFHEDDGLDSVSSTPSGFKLWSKVEKKEKTTRIANKYVVLALVSSVKVSLKNKIIINISKDETKTIFETVFFKEKSMWNTLSYFISFSKDIDELFLYDFVVDFACGRILTLHVISDLHFFPTDFHLRAYFLLLPRQFSKLESDKGFKYFRPLL